MAKEIDPFGYFDLTPQEQSSETSAITAMFAGIASGVDGLFIETHPSPDNAKSDGKNMLPLEKLENLLVKLIKIKSAI